MNDLIKKVATEAGKFLIEKFDQRLKIEFKGDYDLVTEADRRSEDLIVRMIREQYPDHNILAEEGHYQIRQSDYRWIIDPLDGTTNYAHGFPWFAVSIALEIKGELVLGVVNNPYTKEFYYAEKGGGAYLNNRPIKVSETNRLDRALLATGFAYDHKVCKANNYDNFLRFQRESQACRRPGVASLDLASVAAGRFDGFWEFKLKPWDLAAGILLVHESGGHVTDFDGGPMRLDSQECLASNGLLHDQMTLILQQGCRPIDE